jgi:hypothetical protein
LVALIFWQKLDWQIVIAIKANIYILRHNPIFHQFAALRNGIGTINRLLFTIFAPFLLPNNSVLI